ncbi:MPN313 family protein [Mycoplasmoides pirum]|uniref:MPN313 family protein n=1 Tax=Mycoplasmoides pirum TaxID=2122 RepID=UPI00048694D1|nr:hypothetical protein [Mycoplasmoides pirum]
MKKISLINKKKIIGGLSFWSFAMGAALIVQTLTSTIMSIINACTSSNEKQINNNSWSKNYNQYNPSSSQIALKFGFTPKQSAMFFG